MFSLFKTRKPRQFEYQPRYWDPRKEALEARIKRIEQEIAIEKGEKIPPARTLRRGFMRGEGSRSLKSQHRSSNIRILIILAALSLFLYLYLYR
jgi:hypothetical protein